MRHWTSRDWVRIILAFSLMLSVLGFIVSVLVHGPNYSSSDAAVAMVGTVLGGIVSGLLLTRRDEDEDE